MDGMKRSSGARRWALALAAVLPLAACDDPVGPQAELTQADAEAVAAFVAGLAGAGAAASLDLAPADAAGLAAITREVSFTQTRDCPAGGAAKVEGERKLTIDRDAGTASGTFESTHTYADCGVTRGERTLTLNGAIEWSGSIAWQLPSDGAPRQLTEFSGSREGTLTITSGEESRTCEIDLTKTYDAAAKTWTVSGTVCGREVSVTRPAD